MPKKRKVTEAFLRLFFFSPLKLRPTPTTDESAFKKLCLSGGTAELKRTNNNVSV